MTKLNLPDIGTLANSAAARQAINENFASIEDAIDNTISRDGTTPNSMEADLDLNDHFLINVADPVNDADGVNLRSVRPIVEQFVSEIAETIIEGTARVEVFTATAGQTEFVLEDSPGTTNNLMLVDSGIVMTPDVDYTLTGGDLKTVSFFIGRDAGNEIVARYTMLAPSDSLLRADLNSPAADKGAALVKVDASTSLKTWIANLLTETGSTLMGWAQTGVGAFTRTVKAKMQESASVLDYINPSLHAGIKAGTELTTQHAAFNSALTAHGDVFVPEGIYYLTDKVTIPQGKRLRGAGRRKTVIRVPATFNLAATGVFQMAAAEPGGEISDMTIEFVQPDSAVSGDYTAYPPAIYAQSCPRFVVRRMRIAEAWVGIDLKGNSGGATIEDLELSSYNIGIDIDGSLDSIKIDKLHLWPFPMSGASFTANKRTVFAGSYGIKSGRCDDFHLSDSLIFSVTKGVYFYNSAGGRTFGNVVNVDFDDRGGLQIDTNADICVSSCVFTLGKTDSRLMYMTGGTLQLANSRFRADVIPAAANGAIEITGGAATFDGCQMFYLGNDAQFLYWTNAIVNVVGGYMVRNQNIAYTIPFFRASTSARGVITGVQCSSLGSGSTRLVTIDTDTGLTVHGNSMNGWTVGTPTGALTNTMVDRNLGVGSNKDTFVGYFSSDGTTTLKLPTGWSVSKAGTGNYAITHNLSLASTTDCHITVTCVDLAGGIAQWDLVNTTVNQFRVRTYVGTTPTDAGVSFFFRRYRA